MIIDLLSFAALALLGHLGWRRGTVLTALSAGAIAAGYLGALVLYRPFGYLIQGVFGAPMLLAFPLGSLAAFVIVSTIVRIVAARVAVGRTRRTDRGWTPSRVDRAGGAALGVAWGAAIVIVVGWGMVAIRGLTGQGPDVERTVTGRVASRVVGAAVFSAVRGVTGNEILASTLALVAVRPQTAATSLNALFDDPRLRMLFENPSLRAALLRGDAGALVRHPSVQSLATDPEFLEAAYAVSLLDGDSNDTSARLVSEQLVQRLGPIVQTTQTLADDPEIQEALADPALQEKLAEMDLGALATDPAFNRLAEKILGSVRGQSP